MPLQYCRLRRFPTPALSRFSYTCRSSSTSHFETPNPLPATFLRGGTSKGIFLRTSDLPADESLWPHIFLGIMGSPDPLHARQLNGMGGGVSSLSKIMLIGPSEREGVDVEYTFVQVGIKEPDVDLSGNCGNLSCMARVFALDEGMCTPKVIKDGRTRIRSYNTNTKKIIDTKFPVSPDGVPVLDTPEVEMAGVPGKASRIVLEFVDPSGARTGKLLPTTSAKDTLSLALPFGEERPIHASLVDATNPTVFVPYHQLSKRLPLDEYLESKEPALSTVSKALEYLRQQGAVKMGLNPQAKAQPKIAILSLPSAKDRNDGVDIIIYALSMGVLHRAVPMTVGLCLGVAAKVQGTIAWDIVQQTRKLRTEKGDSEFVRIRHPSGIVDVGAEVMDSGEVKSAKVVRTGRRLMKGAVWW